MRSSATRDAPRMEFAASDIAEPRLDCGDVRTGFHIGKFCVFVEGWCMTYDWSGRRMRRMRAAKLTIISLVAAFILTAPIFAHY